ncbi:MAG: competence/damage-inducible protein A [Bacteroidales bacterium]|nr:competence/damage-inducible protein A [Bacteroidales bacterium]
MKAEIVNIGDEMLIGQVVNTNASWIGEQLNLAGFVTGRITIVPDRPEDILGVLQESFDRNPVVLMTGGLGPTRDDVTKEALCQFFNTRLVQDDEVLRDVEAMFRRRGIPMNPLNLSQALVPQGCTVIRNPNGTAPGMMLEKDQKICFSMPGVPFEMRPMITEFVLPELKRRFIPAEIIHRTILTHGIGESALAGMLEHWEVQLPGHFRLAYLPQPGLVRLRITATGTNHEALAREVEEQTGKLARIIPDFIIGYEPDSLEQLIGRLLLEKKRTLSTAESCTGGYISHLITSVPGSSEYFRGSAIAYANDIKTGVLGVDEGILKTFGAVSEQIVASMASGCRQLFGTDYCLATSGIAGPSGGSGEKPVGTTWIALAGPHGSSTRKFSFGTDRGRNIRQAALSALNMLRIELIR